MRAFLESRLNELAQNTDTLNQRRQRLQVELQGIAADLNEVAVRRDEITRLLALLPPEGVKTDDAEPDADEGNASLPRSTHTPAHRINVAREILQSRPPGEPIRARDLQSAIEERLQASLTREHFRRIRERLEPELIHGLAKGYWEIRREQASAAHHTGGQQMQLSQ